MNLPAHTLSRRKMRILDDGHPRKSRPSSIAEAGDTRVAHALSIVLELALRICCDVSFRLERLGVGVCIWVVENSPKPRPSGSLARGWCGRSKYVPRIRDDNRALRYEVPLVLVVRSVAMRNTLFQPEFSTLRGAMDSKITERQSRYPSQRLREDSLDVRHLCTIFKCGQSVGPYDGVYLSLALRLYIRVYEQR